MVIQLPSATTIGNQRRSVIDVLMCSRFNSSNGIGLTLVKPMNVHILFNIDHPAVLRQYFGMQV